MTEQLRTSFSQNVCIYSDLLEKRDAVSEKVAGMKERYNELIKQNNKPMFLFCLESLFFQYKIINLEMENYHKTSSLIENRIYGDYYKLYNMMIFQCKENNIIIDSTNVGFTAPLVTYKPRSSVDVTDLRSVKSTDDDLQNADELDENKSPLPVYKDIDPFIKYRLEDIKRVHECILSIIDVMNNLTTIKMENIQYHRTDVALGFSLNIFIQTLEYEISLIQGQIQLFINYILFYHSSQRTYLEKLLKKIELFATEMQNIVLIPNITGTAAMKSTDDETCSSAIHDIDYYEENDTESFRPVLALETLYTHKTEEAVIHNPVSGDIREHDTPNHESVENVTMVDDDSVSDEFTM
jgi:hypothetical protein